ncbi:MAG: proline dehydrogenase family protein [Bacteroidota bacterium]
MAVSITQTTSSNISFSNTEVAFRSKSDNDLRRSYLLFKAIGYNWLVNAGPALVKTAFALRLPIRGLVKATVFKQFCGGESMNACDATMRHLFDYGIGSILDYSVEGKEAEQEFDHTMEETIATVLKAKGNKQIPFCVFKVTGLARFDLLVKVNEGLPLSADEKYEFSKVEQRMERICKTAYENNVRIFIDAEESWIQVAIDGLATQMMQKFNGSLAIVFNTIQLYRHDRLAYLKRSYEQARQQGYYYGVKLVRGAYMEKERERAAKMGYQSPIQPDKAASDRDYDEALRFCLNNIAFISLCAGSHNENSSQLLVQLMAQEGLANNDERIYFSQLFGMSDHISYNLSAAGYNVAKYLPYGPVEAVLPYLIRRAQENTSAKGQAGRELTLITSELKRRRLKQ